MIGFLATEAGYRALLRSTQPYHFLGNRSLWYFQASPYRYHEEFGFEYVPGEYHGGTLFEGRVTECHDPLEEWVINERGNSGRIRGSYEDAELKILVFGDSATQRPRRAPSGDYMTWPNYLQDLLEQELGRSVHVVNFARDAYGVLQMFDLAAAKVGEWRPHLAIVAFISDDLTRDRFWRTTTLVDGHERILTSSVPDPDPDWTRATDAYLVHAEATSAWCRRMLASGQADDPIARALEERLREGRRRATLLVDPWSLSQSFVLDRIRHGDPFYSTYTAARPSQLPRHELTDFAEDPHLGAKLGVLEATGIPYLLVHLALYSELAEGVEYRGRERERRRALVESLERLTGRAVRGTLDHAPLPVDDLEALAHHFPGDLHPSLRGHRFYAETVAEILRRHADLDGAGARARFPVQRPPLAPGPP